MFMTPDQIVSANKANTEAFVAFTQGGAVAAFSAIEKLLNLNVEFSKAALQASLKTSKEALSVKDPQELVSFQAGITQPAVESAIAYGKSAYDIVAEAQAEILKQAEAKGAEFSKGFVSLLDKAAKSAPAGSDVAFAAVKSALAASTSAYDNISKAAKQVSEIAEANVAAATNATVKAVTPVTTSKRKAA
jgi:phasin family protein